MQYARFDGGEEQVFAGEGLVQFVNPLRLHPQRDLGAVFAAMYGELEGFFQRRQGVFDLQDQGGMEVFAADAGQIGFGGGKFGGRQKQQDRPFLVGAEQFARADGERPGCFSVHDARTHSCIRKILYVVCILYSLATGWYVFAVSPYSRMTTPQL